MGHGPRREQSRTLAAARGKIGVVEEPVPYLNIFVSKYPIGDY